jgi:hypothetical protein
MGIIEQILENCRQEGIQQEAKRHQQAFATSLLQHTHLSLSRIAEEVGVTEAYVQNIKEKLQGINIIHSLA